MRQTLADGEANGGPVPPRRRHAAAARVRGRSDLPSLGVAAPLDASRAGGPGGASRRGASGGPAVPRAALLPGCRRATRRRRALRRRRTWRRALGRTLGLGRTRASPPGATLSLGSVDRGGPDRYQEEAGEHDSQTVHDELLHPAVQASRHHDEKHATCQRRSARNLREPRKTGIRCVTATGQACPVVSTAGFGCEYRGLEVTRG